MPIPVILWVIAAGASAWGVGKVAAGKSQSQASEIASVKHQLEADHARFEVSVNKYITRMRDNIAQCIEDTNTMFARNGVIGDTDALHAQAVLTRADLPAHVRQLIERLRSLHRKHDAALPQVVSSQSAVLAATSRNAAQYNVVQRYIPPALGPLVAIAWVGAMVVETGGKLTAVLQNARSLSQLETAKEEIAASYREQLAAAKAESSAISGLCNDIIQNINTLLSARTPETTDIARALRFELSRTVRETLG